MARRGDGIYRQLEGLGEGGRVMTLIPSWLAAILTAVGPLIPGDFVGQIEINVFKGGISNVNVKQSFKGKEGG